MLNTIRDLCNQRKIKWSVHAAARMQEGEISRKDVISCINNGKIIEDYPDDFPSPSCLIMGNSLKNSELHIVLGYSDEFIFIITAYYPDKSRFNNDLRLRKE